VLQYPEKSSLLYRAPDTPRTVENLIVAVLFQAQRECTRIGDRVHDALVREVKTQDTVISYNYDLLLDQALWKAGKASSDDYGVVFAGQFDGIPGPSAPEQYVREPKIHSGVQETTESVPVLKLHASAEAIPSCSIRF
jgi:hypothetical protein